LDHGTSWTHIDLGKSPLTIPMNSQVEFRGGFGLQTSGSKNPDMSVLTCLLVTQDEHYPWIYRCKTSYPDQGQ